MASKLDTLNAMIADDNAPSINHVAQNGTTVKKNVIKTVAPTAPVKTEVRSEKSSKIGSVAVLNIDGFDIAFKAGTLDTALVKATATRTTTNVWYAIVKWLATQPTGFLTITRSTGSKAKSPMSKIDSALSRARKLEVKNWSNMTAKTGQEKGVWYLVKFA